MKNGFLSDIYKNLSLDDFPLIKEIVTFISINLFKR